MKKRLLPLAMLAGLAGAAGTALCLIVETIREAFALFVPGQAQLDVELAQARQVQKVTDNRKPVPEAFGTAQARWFVAMLRSKGGYATA